MTEEWEQSFLPLEDTRAVRPPGVTTCAHCGELLHIDDALHKSYYNGKITDVEHFCNEDHHAAWYIKRLNQTGL